MNLLLLLLTLTVVILTYLRRKTEKKQETVLKDDSTLLDSESITSAPQELDLSAPPSVFEAVAVSETVKFLGLQSPDWVKNAVVYQVNVRQFSKAGNLKAVENDLERIKDLGADILWMMPIFPICEAEKKCDENSSTACWGSPYAPSDFDEVHEKYGTKADFRQFVEKSHQLGLKVILDFVPNHTGWDSKWMREHPEWYVQKDGKIMPVTSDQGEIWADIAQFDLTNQDLREAWMQVHEYWVREFDLDGYREDCAWAISKEWWQELRERLNKIRPVYMLAEDEVHGEEQFEVCFETNYGWGTHAIMKDIYKGIRTVNDLVEHTESIKTRFGKQGWQLNFTQNHDENTWHGSETDLFGAGADAFTALCFTMEGMGLIYNGQEASLQQRLSFFNKDEINWAGASRANFFKTLTDLKHRNKALWNGMNGGFINRIETEHSEKVYAFTREKEGDMVLAVFNLSDGPLSISLEKGVKKGVLVDVFTKEETEVSSGMTFELKPFEFHIFSDK